MRKRIGLYVLLIIILILFLVPIYVLVTTSLKSFEQVSLAKMWDLPVGLNLDSFVSAFSKLKNNILNSIYLTIPATIISALIGSWNGYIFSKWKFRGSDLIFTLILFGMFIPYQSILIPLALVMKNVGLYGTIPGLILTHVIYGIPIVTLIFRNYYAGVQNEIVEASKVDGSNIFGTYFHIMLRIAMPAFVVAIVWQFTSIWNEYLFAIILAHNPSVQPATVALANLAGSKYVEWNVQMAGALIVSLPPLIVYIFFGRYFIQGLLAGSVKG